MYSVNKYIQLGIITVEPLVRSMINGIPTLQYLHVIPWLTIIPSHPHLLQCDNHVLRKCLQFTNTAVITGLQSITAGYYNPSWNPPRFLIIWNLQHLTCFPAQFSEWLHGPACPAIWCHYSCFIIVGFQGLFSLPSAPCKTVWRILNPLFLPTCWRNRDVGVTLSHWTTNHWKCYQSMHQCSSKQLLVSHLFIEYCLSKDFCHII